LLSRSGRRQDRDCALGMALHISKPFPTRAIYFSECRAGLQTQHRQLIVEPNSFALLDAAPEDRIEFRP
jgi:hypothetical protein